MKQYIFPSQNVCPQHFNFTSVIKFCWVCSSFCILTQKGVNFPSSSLEVERMLGRGAVGRAKVNVANSSPTSNFFLFSPR